MPGILYLGVDWLMPMHREETARTTRARHLSLSIVGEIHE